ncbi:glycosyltransferase family 2 protein [Aliarcobacter butzleri]|uniref:Glycosyltransferase family 2 protein n=1 Tax=Aliarcobacter butzleri TaxID=28197 RepID=A0AAP4UZL3_9BACT|nr:glycosyltransferase family 2 protein [Aliarcobacter butzleri]MDN5053004.1 glycosyltransferase family 2 protein [Aliarcobacter butzleri]MDN5076012.1 glycosyltransferase family 2 protein [Aliarcobacter butzleri]MDN5117381.1 glycosyltransferase family 2 protein [Aliarcobacter butzleri]MDN5133251.1 glycosyltransferase family 2 protein [Aliarcobacter butzleri]NUW26523.1 glycosyltransferase family 2 protein [Aliarcobacter butzleri]
MKKISFVITSYNRKKLISNTIESIISQILFFDLCEIIIVDDASTDNTVDYLYLNYKEYIDNKDIKIISLEKNLGVSGAKNEGYINSTLEWVVFIDSDDQLLPNILEKMINVLTNTSLPLVFFRCIDQNNNFIGKKFNDNKTINIEEYLEYTSYGEALTAVNKNIVKEKPYITELRGYEGIGCSRIINKFGFALLSNLVARIYFVDGMDRLSVSSGFLKRMSLLSKGHFLMLKEFGKFMTFKNKFFYLIKAIAYYVVGNIYNFIKGNK